MNGLQNNATVRVYSRIAVDLMSLPPEKALIGGIVLKRAADRTKFSAKAQR